MKYDRIFVAGTFDGLHKGHRFLLMRAFEFGKKVSIGLTSDRYVNTYKKGSPSKTFSLRKKALKDWLSGQGVISRATVIPIHNPFEPAASFPESAALMVTSDNKKRGQELNIIRKKRGLQPLTLVEAPLVPAYDEKPISSTRVRNGEIDTEGRLILPTTLRSQLSQPLGLVLQGGRINESFHQHARERIISVGDMATKTLLDQGIIPDLAIIDKRVGRKSFIETERKLKILKVPVQTIQSGPGYISKKAIEAVRTLLTKRRPNALLINGEEDLLTLPAVAYTPEGSVVYYGQPPLEVWGCGPTVTGLVEVVVTKEAKKKAIELLGRFTQ